MAAFNLVITYPDEKATELLTALRNTFGQVPDEGGEEGALRDMTPTEIKDQLEVVTVNQIKRMYTRWKRRQADVSLDLES